MTYSKEKSEGQGGDKAQNSESVKDKLVDKEVIRYTEGNKDGYFHEEITITKL